MAELGKFRYGGDARRAAVPIPGTILTRAYKGQLLSVTVLPKGFDYEGTIYRSLSAIAKVITGTHWNGHLFFDPTAPYGRHQVTTL